ncbi:glycoside hydrolase domain-containing protein [Paenibacillus arenilitoris]|uniref:DUF4091 domain-containing protein n=1 Tax=Paenibacillus arenilitoris TaxID=2772299 RepID=A0A927H4Z1_9BACL|nr:glycoside hydrolase domain-containing protein [Paenibacillus arenilitoris]MBD2867004.1 DUF4091 domain-containing protein [Paenibacillus arenilitoris]
MNGFETRCLSSLTKVFADEELQDKAFNQGSALLDETFSFQIAFRSSRVMRPVRVAVKSDLSRITVRTVGLVPSEFPCYPDHDEHIVRRTPGLYPDPLFPVQSEGVTAVPGQWRSIWVTVDLAGETKPGDYEIEVRFELDSGEELGKECLELEVFADKLPEQRLIHTEWFHCDCLATYYGVDVFSEEHWELIEKYVHTAVTHGVNMLLTPLFTPPLDTEVGGERPTVQLVDVEKTGDTYRFGFDRLERWIRMCGDKGIRYFEFSHLFTQWGAKHAPKIVATVEGERKKIFGWETEASGDAYRSFLSQFLPELTSFLHAHRLEERSYFHVSDEPNPAHLEQYQSAVEMIRGYLSDFPVIDALSDYEFYEKGLVKNPIPATNHIEPFLEHGVPDLWTYYCCGQYKEVSNRFFHMPSARNRILGMQLYKFNMKGFLHWGYNFWYSFLSRKPIDPFKTTDADYAFPSGDAFVVYPGPEGPIESLRLEVFREALQDLRALRLLEDRIGRENTLELLEEGLRQPLTFSEYPRDPEWLLSKRETINRKINECRS